MVEIPGGVSFPVVFHDGERDADIGSVVVSASTEFKNFQSSLSNMIGISSHQFTVYLAEYKTSLDSSSTKIRRRIPITGKVNFGAISGEKNSFFLVVLKRSRRERRRKGNDKDEDEYYFPSTTKTKTKTNQATKKKKNPPENVMLLRRNTGIENQSLSGFISPAIGRFEYEQRLRKMQFEKEKYLINMGLSKLTVDGDGGRNGTARAETAVCWDCVIAKETGVAAGFHCCAHDAVTAGFRSHAGPISRPVKESD